MTATMGFTELSSTDSEASRLFLEKAFRWRFQGVQTANGEYLTYRSPEGNMLCIRAGQQAEAPASINYVRVQNLKQAEDNVRAANGKIVLPRTELPGMGSFFWFQIPSGPLMACWQDAPERQRLSEETRK
jgi:predicted enzyme related to lactoylglutathione lyase